MSETSRRLLVTGATGFLGSAVVGLARSEGWRVRALSRGEGTLEGADFVTGDIRDVDSLRKASKGIDAIVHAAGLAHVFGSRALHSSEFRSVNETGTRNVIDAAISCGVPHVVLASSVSVYGGYSGSICDETTPCNPVGAYAASKYAAECRAAERVADSGTSLTVLRFATIYGSGDRGNVLRLISSVNRSRFLWVGSGGNKKSLIHRSDAARACLLPLNHQRHGVEVFNVTAQIVPMQEIVTLISHSLGRRAPRLRIPMNMINAIGKIARAAGDRGHLELQISKFTRDDAYDGTRFQRTFGFVPQISLATGLREEIDNMRIR